MQLFRAIKRYKKRLEKRFTQQIGRKQLNVMCDNRLILQLKALASYLEIPIYPLCEHVLQLGLAEVLTGIEDEALKENLERHLLQDHLLVKELQAMDETTSRRALRLRNTMKLLDLIELKAGSPEAVREIIARLVEEA